MSELSFDTVVVVNDKKLEATVYFDYDKEEKPHFNYIKGVGNPGNPAAVYLNSVIVTLPNGKQADLMEPCYNWIFSRDDLSQIEAECFDHAND